MNILKVVATLMSLAIAGVGLLGVVAPGILLGLAGSLAAPPALYWVAAVRVVFGALLVLVATDSRAPRTLRVIGVFIVVAGLSTPLWGTERFAAVLAWFSAQAPTLVRAVAAVPVLVGACLAYAINPRRRVSA